MAELNNTQFHQLGLQINRMGIPKLQELFDKYTYQGRSLRTEDFPNMDAARKQALDSYLNRPRPNAAEQQEWSAIVPHLANLGPELVNMLSAYISHWSELAPLENHLAEASSYLQQATAQVESQDWLDLDHFSLLALESYMQKYPCSAHLGEIDDEYYALASDSSNPQISNNLQRYITLFPAGRHNIDANTALNSLQQWNDVKLSGDLSMLYDYMESYPDSPFCAEAEDLLLMLKQQELAEMRSKFNEYNRNTLLYYITKGIFSEQELCDAGVATPESLEILRNYNEVASALPDLDSVCARCKPECKEDYTDVYMFGIPGTGKSCILTGLIGENKNIVYNSVLSGGSYADALSQFVRYGCPPPPTKESYLTTIQATVNDDKGNPHNLNLVEMAGEEFAFKIAENENAKITFDDMGSGATELLVNKNRKIFFLIIDLSKDVVKHQRYVQMQDEQGNIYFDAKTFQVDQKKCIKRIVDIFGLPENANVMKNVDAIHFIVTKSDMLDPDPERRKAIAMEKIKMEYSTIIDTLSGICDEYGINHSTKGRPKLYTFSLGKFYVGNVFEYDPSDSTMIVEAIKAHTRGTRKRSFGDIFGNIFS